jgi:hypothetical protein
MIYSIIEQVILVAAHQHLLDFYAFKDATDSIDYNEFAPDSVLAATYLLDDARVAATQEGNLRLMTLEQRIDQDMFYEWCNEHCEVTPPFSTVTQ